MYRRTHLIAVVTTDRIEDNEKHPKALTAVPPTGEIALRRSAYKYGFCAFKNDHISLA